MELGLGAARAHSGGELGRAPTGLNPASPRLLCQQVDLITLPPGKRHRLWAGPFPPFISAPRGLRLHGQGLRAEAEPLSPAQQGQHVVTDSPHPSLEGGVTCQGQSPWAGLAAHSWQEEDTGFDSH